MTDGRFRLLDPLRELAEPGPHHVPKLSTATKRSVVSSPSAAILPARAI